MGAKNLAPTGIRSPDRPARSESLYRLSYPGRQHQVTWELCDSLTQFQQLRQYCDCRNLAESVTSNSGHLEYKESQEAPFWKQMNQCCKSLLILTLTIAAVSVRNWKNTPPCLHYKGMLSSVLSEDQTTSSALSPHDIHRTVKHSLPVLDNSETGPALLNNLSGAQTFTLSISEVWGSYRKSWATIFCQVTCFIIDKPNTPP